MDRESLILAKRRLYSALLAIPPDDISDGDVDLMFALSQDADIQAVLDTALKKEAPVEVEDTSIDMEDDEDE